MSHPTSLRPRTCVVVSFWNGRSAGPLYRLLSQMRKVDSGSPFDTVVVCNGGDEEPLRLPSKFADLRPQILDRENQGFNIGAWDHGWRNAGDYEYYLFIQDDCFLKGRSWVSGFESRFDQDAGIGLLGEHVVYDRMTWDHVRRWTFSDYWGEPSGWPEPVHPIDRFRSLFEARGIPWSDFGQHLPTIILFSSRRVLEEIGGFPYFGPSYQEAIASELAISRLVESKGYRIAKVTDQSFQMIGHPQWSPRGRPREPGLRGTLHEAWWKAKGRIGMMLGHRGKAQRLGIAHAHARDNAP